MVQNTTTAETGVTNAPVYHERFKDALWYGQPLTLTVGGAGGIGSWLTFFLASAGHEILLYDFDTVEHINMAGQLYGNAHVGKKKTAAMSEIVKLLCGEVKINDMGKFGEGGMSVVTGVTFMAFDNMKARKLMAEEWYKMQIDRKEKGITGGVNILIDGRMEAESGMILVVRSKGDYERYMAEDMFEDHEVPDGPCSYRATRHNGARIASEMMNVLNNHIVNKRKGRSYRSVPYKIEYEMPTLGYAVIDRTS